MQKFHQSVFKNLNKIKESVSQGRYSDINSLVDNIDLSLKEYFAKTDKETRITNIERQLYYTPKNLDETMDRIATLIRNEFAFSRFDIVIIDHWQKRVIKRYSRGGFGEEDLIKLARHGALGATKNYALTHKEPWIVNDVKKQDPLWKLALELDVWIHGTFPLYFKKKSGKIELQGLLHGARNKEAYEKGHILDEDQVSQLKQLGLAINRAINEAKLSYFEHGIMNIQNVIGSTRIDLASLTDNESSEDTKNQMNTLIDTIMETIGASMGGIIIKEDNSISSFSWRNHRGESLPNEHFKLSPRPLTGLVSRALFDGYAVIENEVSDNQIKMDLNINNLDEKIHTLLAVPLIESYAHMGSVRRSSIGALVLLNKKDNENRVIKTDFEGNEGGFSSIDKNILESISPHIETIISNTRCHMALHVLSLTDGLTGLANHSYFMNDLLDKEFKRAGRYSVPMALLLMDIDHFKVFNDVFGHQVGDLVIRETASIIKNNSREVDHIARYGGEEFSVILPNTHRDDALLYAEKIRKLVKNSNYVEKICENKLFDIYEAKKRLKSMLTIEDDNIRNAKAAVMKNHFNLDIYNLVKIMDSGELKQAADIILDGIKVSLSIGVGIFPYNKITEKNELLNIADMMLLKAKENGRDRVEAVDPIS